VVSVRAFLVAVTAAFAILADPAAATVTPFRFQDLDLRDPHVFVSFLGCHDVTDTQLYGYSLNNELQKAIQTDGTGDGQLDLNFVLIFDALEPGAASERVRLEECPCTAPQASTVCYGSNTTPIVLTATFSSSGTCLTTLAGTLHAGYSPAVTLPAAPCFVTTVFDFDLALGGGIFVPLRDAQIAGTLSGSPPDRLLNGLLRGFLRQSDADSLILPASLPLIGGKKFSTLLPGGTGACPAYSDKDTDSGVSGWWMYLNFVAAKVPYAGPTLGVGPIAGNGAWLEVSPNPAHGPVEFRFRLGADGGDRVAIYDLLGRRVRELDAGGGEGPRRVTWDGRRDAGDPAPAGLYVVRAGRGTSAPARRFLLVR